MHESNWSKITAAEEEEYANTYFYFIEALKVLSSDPKTQCDVMGNINVAWEIKDDVSRGSCLLEMPQGKLTSEEHQGIYELMKVLDGIPTSVLSSANSEEANKVAMNHSCWVPLRMMASNLLKVLHKPT